MSRNAGESRIPLPRAVKPSLLPKLRSLVPPKIGSANHRRHSPTAGYCPSNKQPQQQQPHYVFGRLHQAAALKQPCCNNKQLNEQTFESHKGTEELLAPEQVDLSISALWDAGKDNKEAEHLMRLSNEQLSLFRSQEELAQDDSTCLKRRRASFEEFDLELASGNRQQQEEANSKLESPLATGGPPHYLMLQTKQNSFEHDESSLGILTPDQMTDFTVALESSRTPSCENLSARDTAAGNFLLSKSNALVAAAARHLDIVASVPAPISPNDRSPSYEDLPLDPRPVLVQTANNNINDDEDSSSLCAEDAEGARASELALSAKTSDSTETSAAKALPTSFVTSVTSITSLEAGYQGDGENSRPASRGAAEPLSLLPSALSLLAASALGTHVERNCCSKQDPMTDSDFFTESDADEVVRGGAGDRRAQVIDGTLFCPQSAERRCPGGFEPAEEMDSSGIYSDLDKRQDSSGLDLEPEPEEPENATDTADTGDTTGDTGDTEISVRSQPSPHETTPLPALVTKNVLTPDVLNDTLDSNSTVSTAEVTVIKCQKNEQNAATRTKSNSFSNKENSAPLKKYKMPRRNVISKIKTMIEANQNLLKEETESEPKRAHRQKAKNGRWDAVMNKIEAGKQRGRNLKKEVKSRVLQGLPNSTTSSSASTSNSNSAASSSNNKDKRRMRGRPEISCSNQELARSSLRSSASDLSSTHSKEAPKRPTRKTCVEAPTSQVHQQHQPNNNQISSNLNKSKSNLSTVKRVPSIKSVQSVNVKQKNTTTNKVTDRNQPPSRAHKQLSASAAAAVVNNNNNNNNNNNHNNQHHQENESNNNNNVDIVVVAAAAAAVNDEVKPLSGSSRLESREQQVQTEEPSQDWSKKAEDTVQALAITVQYFTHQLHLEDLAGSRLRQRLDAMKTEWLSTNSELEELRLDKASIEEALNHERNQHLHRLQSLTHDLEQERTQRASLEKRLQEERRQIERLQGCLEERQREEKTRQERLQAEQELQLSRVSSSGQQEPTRANGLLAAEVESLRTVLEIRSQENSQLRAEVDLLRRELDDKEQVKLKCDSLEARCEDLKAQLLAKEESDRQLGHENEKLIGSIHQLSKQNKRLSQRNEELLWRLRQKNEVVSVLTNQLTPQSQQRLSKSLQPSSSSSNNSQLDATTTNCSMKYMVEKGDSVSWTLDISDSFETCHSSQSFGLSNSSSSSCCSSSKRHTGSAINGGGSGVGSLGPNRARSNSTSVVDNRPAKSAKTSLSHNNEQAAAAWKPSHQSTPLQRRRNDHSWSLSNTLTEPASSQGPKICSAKTTQAALQVSTDDDDDDDEEDDACQRDHEVETLGQRPQEAGGEAMISEETSTSSSSEDDESSVSSGDIP